MKNQDMENRINDPSRESTLGMALIDRSLIDALRRLWEGPVYLDDIPKIELILRAFITSKTMIPSKIINVWEEPENPSLTPIDYEQPFNDHYLDYEFADPGLPHPYSVLNISQTEQQILKRQVSKLESKALSAVPAVLNLSTHIIRPYGGFLELRREFV